MSFIFDKSDSPQINVSKYALNHFLNSIPDQKTVSEVLKTWYFPHSAFCSAGQWGGRGVKELQPIVFPLAMLFSVCDVFLTSNAN